ncbi:hypothetical protein BWI96_15035 [Siphonobacter sp. SORGH_AS_0500]|uniref:porin family protein n=1 Tax=Siphonobacter sp. SORGH_AS_0500 TaxID=1864824 RepID=UPI000CBFCAFA|nr:porin family protein [Siphonobacter sp. SORGH_AS_0500]PKK35842.1 hypothetical protein BWI96_15035 [Siphonobacter sp. SORGH_AS_0500]
MKFFTWLLFLLAPLGAMAQSKLVFKAGGNVSSMSQALSSELDAPISKAGFHAGLGSDIPLTSSGNLTIQPTLLFVQRGYIADFKQDTRRASTTLNYLDLPVNVTLKLGNEERNTKFLLFGGGYVACGLGGKTIERESGQPQTEYSVRFNYDLQRFDYGVQGGIGVQFDFFQLSAFYQQGLANVSEMSQNAKNQTFGLSISYLFDNIF